MSKNPKPVHYGGSESNDFRVALGVCTKNVGAEKTVVRVNEQKQLSPGRFTMKYRADLDKRRRKESLRSKNVVFKRKRLTGKKVRAQRRALIELSEGQTYQTGCGFEGCDNDDIDEPVPLPSASDDTKVVVLDTETTGLGKFGEIVQIAAKHGDMEFNQYILPSKGGASQTHTVISKGCFLYLYSVLPFAFMPSGASAERGTTHLLRVT